MAYMVVSTKNSETAICANWFSIGWAPISNGVVFANKEHADKVCEALNLMADRTQSESLRAVVAEVQFTATIIRPDICGDCATCKRKICTGAKSLQDDKQNHKQEGAESMRGITVRLNERNTARLLKVAELLECKPETFLNEFLMSGLEDPCAAVECMDFTEGGTVGRRDAERARKRVRAAAMVLAREGWDANVKG
jgi:hypothetical protein